MNKNLKLSFFYSQIIFLILLPIWIKLTNYLHPIVLVIVWSSLSLCVISGTCWVKKEKIQLPIYTLHIFTFLYSIGLLTLLFIRPKNQDYSTFNLVPFDTIQFYFSDRVDFLIAFYNLGGNIGLFLPFGLYYKYIKKDPSLKKLILNTICSIGIIEILQYLTKRGSLDVDDLLLNVLGVCIGYLTYPFFKKVLNFK